MVSTFKQIFNDNDLPITNQPYVGLVVGKDVCVDVHRIFAPVQSNWTNCTAKWWCAVWVPTDVYEKHPELFEMPKFDDLTVKHAIKHYLFLKNQFDKENSIENQIALINADGILYNLGVSTKGL